LNPANETGLIAYYRFEEGTGTQVTDISGNNNNGTAYNCTWSIDVPFSSGINSLLNLHGAQSVCSNDSLLLQTPVKSNLKYIWYRNGTIINNAPYSSYYAKSSGNYYCLISDTVGSCQKYSDTVALTLNSIPVQPVINGPLNLSGGILNAVYTSMNTAGLTHFWSVNNGSIQSGQGTNSISVLWGNSGPYSLKLIIEDNNVCKNSVSLIITQSVGIPSALNQISGLTMYPNPACNKIIFQSNTPLRSLHYIIADATGRQVSTGELNNKTIEVDISSLKSGFYFVMLSDPSNCEYSAEKLKLLKQY
jgi:hypothetical protein